jgi:hypothetical protein
MPIKDGSISESGKSVRCFDGDEARGCWVSRQYCITCDKCHPLTAKQRYNQRHKYIRKADRIIQRSV